MRLFVVATCVVAACLASSIGTAWADIFQFVDRDGNVHYTNVQPSGPGWKRVYRTERENGYAAGGTRAATRTGLPRQADPERLRRYDAHIQEASDLYQLPVSFIRAVMLVESNFYPHVVSVDGAVGLMQLMPGTAASMGVVDAFDPRQNVLGGTRYLRVLANRFNGDLVLTVAAYNAGEGAVQKYRGVPPYAETRRYVRKVLHHYYNFRSADSAVVASR
jgi:soluble lytic murein transglycosylase-like protein